MKREGRICTSKCHSPIRNNVRYSSNRTLNMSITILYHTGGIFTYNNNIILNVKVSKTLSIKTTDWNFVVKINVRGGDDNTIMVMMMIDDTVRNISVNSGTGCAHDFFTLIIW
ncbi:hypothetical protein WUBG_05815 [Wuchereria bancrofti]|uniref:Uncharacterized protein n=1 Tax=Wuchereria bancrofti TaxID=6293 RepID=J9EM56_WUCBA|nr:hypothetical protein WUBG_05815 [Wuchereria bancrofti]